MLSKEEIKNIICVRCGRPIGEREWTMNCEGKFVCWTNCDGQHPRYTGR